MNKSSLRNAAISCLALWATIWLAFLSIRFSSLDIRDLPAIGPIMLVALGSVLLAPLAAIVLAGVASVRQPKVSWNWLALACAAAAFFGQGFLFFVSSWM